MLNKPTNFDPEKDIAYNKSSRELRDLRPSESRSISFGCNHLKEFITTCPYPNPVHLTTCPYPLQLYGTSQPFPYGFSEGIQAISPELLYVGERAWIDSIESGISEVSVHFLSLVVAYTIPPDSMNSGGVSDVQVHFPQLVKYSTYDSGTDSMNFGGVSEVGVNFVQVVNYLTYNSGIDQMNFLGVSDVSVHMG